MALTFVAPVLTWDPESIDLDGQFDSLATALEDHPGAEVHVIVNGVASWLLNHPRLVEMVHPPRLHAVWEGRSG